MTEVGSSGRPRRGIRSILLPLGLVLAGLAAGSIFGYSLAASETRQYRAEADSARQDLDRLAQAHETLQERNWILYLDLEAKTASPTPPAEGLPPGTIGDGTYFVGTDIAPGTYQGQVTGEFGYWARLNSTSGMVSGIEANDIVRGPFVLTIVSSDVAVELRGVRLTPKE